MLIRTARRRFEVDTNEYGVLIRSAVLGELFYDPEAFCGRRWLYRTWRAVKQEWQEQEERRRAKLTALAGREEMLQA